jgi:hypothetical protein
MLQDLRLRARKALLAGLAPWSLLLLSPLSAGLAGLVYFGLVVGVILGAYWGLGARDQRLMLEVREGAWLSRAGVALLAINLFVVLAPLVVGLLYLMFRWR